MSMPLIHNYLFPAMWLSYVAYWWAMSTNAMVTERRESVPSRQLDAIVRATKPILVGFARFRDFRVSVVLPEVGVIPLLHGDHRMVGGG